MYLVSNDLELSAESFQTLYKKRWSVEEYHKSLGAEYLIGKVAYKNHYHTNLTSICFIVGLYQIRAAKVCTQTKSFYIKSEDLYGCIKNGMGTS